MEAETKQQKISLSIDLMGGCNAPGAVIKAMEMFANTLVTAGNDPEGRLFFVTYGLPEVEPMLRESSLSPAMYSFTPVEAVVTDHDNPLDLLRRQERMSSMQASINAVRDGLAQAAISSGNTGALMVLAKNTLGCINGIRRPAIVSTFPTKKGQSVILDLGANLECSEAVLLQFAMMGSCFAQVILKRNGHPSVAIVNVGSEETKGRGIERRTYELLKNSGLNFQGYIEGHAINSGVADVIVTDGFTGNVILKTAEGVASYIIDTVKQAVQHDWRSKLGGLLLRPSLRHHLAPIEPHRHNGAMFIGLKGVVVKSHGGSKAEGIAHALDTAFTLVDNGVNQHIADEILRMQQQGVLGSGGLEDVVEKIKSKSTKIFSMLNRSE